MILQITVSPLEIAQTGSKPAKFSPAALKSAVISQEIEGGVFFRGRGIFSWHYTDYGISVSLLKVHLR